MKPSSAVLLALAVSCLAYATGQAFSIPVLDNLALMTTLAGALVLAYYFARFEEKRADTRTIAVLAMLSALAVTGRVIFAPIPNVQPATFIIITAGYVFGPLAGFVVGATTGLVSNFLLGQGPWTIWQMLAWGAGGLLAGVLGRRSLLESRLRISAFCALWGFVYGWVMTFYFVLGFVRPVSTAAFITAYATGLWFDVFHAAGNFAFAFLLGPALVAMLRRYRSRFDFQYLGEKGSGSAASPNTAGPS